MGISWCRVRSLSPILGLPPVVGSIQSAFDLITDFNIVYALILGISPDGLSPLGIIASRQI